MKARRIFGIITIMLLSLINYSFAGEFDYKNEDVMIKAFEEVEADFDSINLNYNGTISKKSMNINGINSIINNIGNKLNINEMHRERLLSPQEKKIALYGKDEKERLITIMVHSFKDEQSNQEETTLFIEVEDTKSYENLKEITSKLDSIFSEYNTNAKITSCIIGTFKGKLDSSEKVKKISKILSIVDGKKVESVIDSSIASVSIYSPHIYRYIYTGNEKMNLNIGMRYDEHQDKTYILMGSPIIAIGY
ncbi:protein of unknown function DUF1779 [Gottschalkia purinilytica]|uniref:TATA-box binding protein n=1 Tax=Gottschalkia purinilytica TaxID=1503 RepID=A0A0L0WE61_GOTPU|nr:YwmB family TATA-box binding protein [Gottschalkia purinilytica]KNF09710.1 protein of unknown function DUF1779 [Gottschalkia purinilytica]